MGAHTATHKKTAFIKKPAAMFAAVTMVLTLLVGVGLFNAPKAEAKDWPNAGKRGTVQGNVYIDNAGQVQAFNKILGDKPIEGVKMNALLLKRDGVIIGGRDRNRLPVPLQVTTDEKGYYSFNFRPLMEKHYGPNATGDQLKIAKGDKIRVWPDESNYEANGALKGLTPKRLNGGTRFTEIRTDNLAWLGMTNYVHGSVSDVNMAYRKETAYGNDTPPDPDHGKHLPVSDWKLTLDHNIPYTSDPVSAGSDLLKKGYVCGYTYSDVKYRYDIWDNDGHRDRNAYPDRVVPGVRVVLTTYKQTWNGKLESANTTRYDFSDKDGRWCIKFDGVLKEINDKATPNDKFMLTVEPPKGPGNDGYDEAVQQFNKAKAGNEEKYKGVNMLTSNSAGLPEGFASVGLNGWHGTIRPIGDWINAANFDVVGFLSGDAACLTRGAYCLPNLHFWDPAPIKGIFGADGAELGLIPTQIDLDPKRYSHEVNMAQDTTVNFELKNVSPLTEWNKVVMVPEGADPSVEANWVADSDPVQRAKIGETTGSITISKDLPKGNYVLYVYPYKGDGDSELDTTEFQDLETYRITDTKGHYYSDQQTRDDNYTKLMNDQRPAASIEKTDPGSTVYAAYEDVAEKEHHVWLRPRGQQSGGVKLPPAFMADITDNSSGSDDPEYTKRWENGLAKNTLSIPQNTEPGFYDFVVYNGYGEEVDRTPVEINGPKMEVAPATIKVGDMATVSITNLNPDSTYTVTFIPKKGDPIVFNDVTTEDGTWSDGIEGTADRLGAGKVTLTKKNSDQVITSKPLTISNERVYGPEIIIPGKQDNNPDMDDYIGNGFQRVMKDKESSRGLPMGARVYRVDWNNDTLFAVHAIDRNPDGANGKPPFDAKYVPGGTADPQTEGTWRILENTYRTDDGTVWDSTDAKPATWVAGKPDLMRLPGYGFWGSVHNNTNHVLTLEFTSAVTGLSDIKTLVFWRAGGGQTYYGVDNSQNGTWQSTAAVLTVGQEIPRNTYCMYPAEGLSASGFTKAVGGTRAGKNYFATKHKWPAGIELENVNDGTCLTGTPEEATAGENFQDFFADTADYPQTNGKQAPLTVRIAVREDRIPPVISAVTTGDKEVKDGDTITITQGEKLPLKLTATDNAALKSRSDNGFTVTSSQLTTINPDIVYADKDKSATLDYNLKTVNSSPRPTPYKMTYKAVDKSGNEAEFTVYVKVNKIVQPPVFSGPVSVEGKVSTAMHEYVVVSDPDSGDNTGKAKGITSLDVIDGSLPDGIRLVYNPKEEKYEFSGTPTKPGSFTVTLQATDVEGATATYTVPFTISDVADPIFDPAKTPEPNYTFEVGQPLNPGSKTGQVPIQVGAKCDGGAGPDAEIFFRNKKTDDTHAYDALPQGLTFDGTTVSGTPSKVNWNYTQASPNTKVALEEGINYQIVATCPGEKVVTRDINITVLDSKGPDVSVEDYYSFKFGEKPTVPVVASDKSNEEMTFSQATCTSTTPQGKTLVLTPDKTKALHSVTYSASSVVGQVNEGIYTCSFDVTDSSKNTTSGTKFTLEVRPNGPLLIVTPETQEVVTKGQGTPIKTISVVTDDPGAATLTGGQKCADTLNVAAPSGTAPEDKVAWDPETWQLTGKVYGLVNHDYTCNFTLTDNGTQESTTRSSVVQVKGPMTGPEYNPQNAEFTIHGIVGRQLEHDKFTVKDGSLAITETATQTLNTYLETGWQYNTETGKFEGTPKKATPGEGVVVTMKGTIPGKEDINFDVPVRFIIDKGPTYSKVPANIGAGGSFTPVITNKEKDRTYEITLTKRSETPAGSNCPAKIGPVAVDGHTAVTIPASIGNQPNTQCVYDVSVVDDNENAVTGQSTQVTVGKVWIEMPNPQAPGSTTPMPPSMQAPGGMPVMGIFHTGYKEQSQHFYTVKLCKASVEPLCYKADDVPKAQWGELFSRDQVKEGTNQDFANPRFVLPLVNGENADQNNTYKLVAYDNGPDGTLQPSKPANSWTITTHANPPAPYNDETGQGAKLILTPDANKKDSNNNPYEGSTVTVDALVKDEFGNIVDKDTEVTVILPNGTLVNTTTDAQGHLVNKPTYEAGTPGTAQETKLYKGKVTVAPSNDKDLLDTKSLMPVKDETLINVPVFDGDHASRVEITSGDKKVIGSISAAAPANKHTITVTFRNKYGDEIPFNKIDTSKLKIETDEPWTFGPDNANTFKDIDWRAGTPEGEGEAPAIIDVASSKAGKASFTVSYKTGDDQWTAIPEDGKTLTDTVIHGMFVADAAAKDPATGSTCDDGKKPSYVEPSVNNQVANGKATDILKIVLRDKFCNPVIVKDSELGTIQTQAQNNASDITLVTPIYKSGDEDGVYFQEATSTKANTYTVKLTAPVAPTDGANLTFIAGTVDPAQSTFNVTEGNKVVGKQTHTLTIKVKDSKGNLKDLPEANLNSLTVTLSNEDGYLTQVKDGVQLGQITHASTGTYTVSISSNKAGTVKVASVHWTPVSGQFTKETNDRAVFIADEPSTEGTCAPDGKAPSYMESTGPSEANGTAQNTLKVVLRDKYCNPVKGKTITAVDNPVLNPSTAVYSEGSDGVYTAKVSSTTAGTHVAKVSAPLALQTDTIFEAGALSDSRSEFEIHKGKGDGMEQTTTNSITAGDDITVIFTPKDGTGNPVDLGNTVTVTLPDNGTVTLTKVTEGSNTGKYIGTATPTKATSGKDVTVTSPNKPNIKKPLTIAAGPITQATPSDDSIDVEANQPVPNPGTFTFKDQYGNPSNDNGGKPVYITVPASGGDTTQEVAQDDIPANGVVTIEPFTARASTTGSDEKILAYKDNPAEGSPASIGEIVVNADPGAPSAVATVLDFAQPEEGQTVSTAAQTDDGKVKLNMVLKNQGGGALANYGTAEGKGLSVKIQTVIDGEPVTKVIKAKTDENGNIIPFEGEPKIEFTASDFDKDNTVSIFLSTDATGTDKISKTQKSKKNSTAATRVDTSKSFVTISEGDKTVSNADPDTVNDTHKHTLTVTLKNKYGDVIDHSAANAAKLTVETAGGWTVGTNTKLGQWKADTAESGENHPSRRNVTSTKAGTASFTVKFCPDGTDQAATCVALAEKGQSDTTLEGTFVAETTPSKDADDSQNPDGAGEGDKDKCRDGRLPSYIKEIGNTAIADGSDWVDVQVQLRDKFCNPITGKAGEISGKAIDGQEKLKYAATGFSPVDGTDGLYKTTVTSKQRKVNTNNANDKNAGFKVVATVGGVDIDSVDPESTNNTAKFDWATPAFAGSDASYFYVKDGPQPADGSLDHSNVIVVMMKDENGNPVVGKNQAVHKDGAGRNTAGMTMTDWLKADFTNQRGDSNYDSTKLVWGPNNTPVNPSLTPSDMANRGFKPATQAEQNGYGVYEMNVASKAAGNAGMSVKCTARDKVVTPKASTDPDNPVGVAVFEAADPSFDKDVMCGSNPQTPASYITATTGATVGGNVTTGPADKQNTVTLVLRDANCNPVKYDLATAKQKISLKKTTGYLDGNATVGDVALGTQDGQYVFKVVSSDAKTYKVAADVKVTDSKTGTVSWDNQKADPVNTAFAAGSLVTDGALKIYKSSDTSHQTPVDTVEAGTPIDIVLTPKDAQNNPLDYGATVTVTLPGNNGTVTLNKQEDGSYKGSATPTKATKGGPVDGKVKFPPGSPLEAVNATLTINPGPPAVASRDAGSRISVIPGNKTPNNDPWTIKDANGNLVGEGKTVYVTYPGKEGGPFTLTTNGESKIQVPEFTATSAMDEQQVTVHSGKPTSAENKIGGATLNTNLTGDASGQTTTLKASPANPIELREQVKVTGVLKDANGNPIKGRHENLSLRITKPKDHGDPDITVIKLTTDDQGNLLTRNGSPISFVAGEWGDNGARKNTVELIEADPTSATDKLTGKDVLKNATVTPAKDPDLQDDPVFEEDPAHPGQVDPNNPTGKSYAWIDWKEPSPDSAANRPQANNSDSHTIHVVLKDKYGDPVEGLGGARWIHPFVDEAQSPDYYDINRVTKEDLDRSKINITENAFTGGTNGQYTATVTSIKAGIAVLKVRVYDANSRSFGASTNFVLPMVAKDTTSPAIGGLKAPFRSGPYDKGKSVVSVYTADNNAAIPADGIKVNTNIRVVFEPKDIAGNPVTLPDGAEIKALIPQVHGDPVEVTLTKQSDGTFSGKYANSEGTPVTKAGVYPITTTIKTDSTAEVQTGPDSPKIRVNSGDPDGDNTTVTFSPADPVPGEETTLTITVKDGQGNPVDKGTKVKVKVPGESEPIDLVVGDNGVAYVPSDADPSKPSSDKPKFTPTKGGEDKVTVTKGDDTKIKDQPFYSRPKPPTDLKANNTGVSGKVEDDVPVDSTVTIYEDGRAVGHGTVANDPDHPGKKIFTATYDDGFTPDENQDLYVDVTADYDGNGPLKPLTSKKAGPVHPDTSKPNAPTVVTDPKNKKKVTGEIEIPGGNVSEDAKVEICLTDNPNKGCYEANVTPDPDDPSKGTYSKTDLPRDLVDGETITVKVTDKTNGNSNETDKVVDFTKPEQPTLTHVINDDGSATVTIKPAAADKNKLKGKPEVTIDGEPVDSSKVIGPKADGSYTVDIPLKDRKKNLVVTATVTDKDNNVSDGGTTTVPKKVTPQVTNPVANDEGVTGKVDEEVPVGSKVTVKDDSGKTIVVGKVTNDCKPGVAKCFNIPWPSESDWPEDAKKINDGDTVKISVTDKRTDVPSDDTSVVADRNKPKVTPDVTNGENVKGKVDDPDSTITIEYQDEQGNKHTVGPVEINEDDCTTTAAGKKECTFDISLPDGSDPDMPKVDPSKPITIVAEDPSGNKDTKDVPRDTGAPEVTDLKFTSGEGDAGTVSGKVTDDKGLGDTPKATITYTKADGTPGKAEVDLTCDNAKKSCSFTNVDLPGGVKDNTEVKVTVKDEAGNTGEATVTADKTPPGTVTVNAGRGENGDQIIVTGDSGMTTTITYVNEAGQTKSCTPVKEVSTGKYTCTLKENAKNGSTVTAKMTDAAGNSTTGTGTVDRGAPTLDINPTKGDKVTGTTSEGATVTVTYEDTEGNKHDVDAPVTCKVVDGNKVCTFDTGDGKMPNIDTTKPIKVVAKDGEKQTSDQITPDTKAPGKPDNITTPDSRTITGKIVTEPEGQPLEPGTTVKVKLPDGTTVDADVNSTDGTFTAKIPTNTPPMKDGDKITVIASDPLGNSDQTTVTVDVDNRITAHIDDGGTEVTGKTDPGSNVWLKDSEGNVIAGPVKAGNDGSYSITIPADHKPIPGEKFIVESKDPAGHVAKKTVTYNPTPPSAPTIDEVTKDGKVNGTTPDGTKVKVCVQRAGATEPVCVEADADGKGGYSVDIPGGPLGPGDKLSVVAIDLNTGATSEPTTFIQPEGKVATKPVISLSKTGAEAGGIALLAVLLTVAGSGAVVVSRRSSRKKA